MSAVAVAGLRCACGHDEDGHHPAGRCLGALPPLDEHELPAWRCPCRRFVVEPRLLRVLRAVQSCTVRAAAQ